MDPFHFLPHYRLVVCVECRFACIANEVATHLRKRHRNISSRERQQIVSIVGQIQNVIRERAELIALQYPPPTADPIPFIDPPKLDGLRCQLCPYIARQPQKIQAHCRNVHGWRNPRKRGRLAVTQSLQHFDVPWTTGVHCQRFFRSREASSWFEVGRDQLQHSSTSPQSQLEERDILDTPFQQVSHLIQTGQLLGLHDNGMWPVAEQQRLYRFNVPTNQFGEVELETQPSGNWLSKSSSWIQANTDVYPEEWYCLKEGALQRDDVINDTSVGTLDNFFF